MIQKRTKEARKYMIIGVIGAVLILAVAFVLFKQFRFKRFVDKTAGFAISYPADWKVPEDTAGAVVLFVSPLTNKLDVFQESVNVVIQDLGSSPRTLTEYTQVAIKQMEVVFGKNLSVVESRSSNLGGQTSHRFVFTGKGLQNDVKYLCEWTIKGKYAYQVTYTALLNQYDTHINKVLFMLNSFKILKE